jgi:hypothetical protein
MRALHGAVSTRGLDVQTGPDTYRVTANKPPQPPAAVRRAHSAESQGRRTLLAASLAEAEGEGGAERHDVSRFYSRTIPRRARWQLSVHLS